MVAKGERREHLVEGGRGRHHGIGRRRRVQRSVHAHGADDLSEIAENDERLFGSLCEAASTVAREGESALRGVCLRFSCPSGSQPL